MATILPNLTSLTELNTHSQERSTLQTFAREGKFEAIRKLLTHIPEDDRLDALSGVLQAILENPLEDAAKIEGIEKLTPLLPPWDRERLIINTLVYAVAHSSEQIVQALLTHITSQNAHQMLIDSARSGNSLFDIAIQNDKIENLFTLLDKFPTVYWDELVPNMSPELSDRVRAAAQTRSQYNRSLVDQLIIDCAKKIQRLTLSSKILVEPLPRRYCEETMKEINIKAEPYFILAETGSERELVTRVNALTHDEKRDLLVAPTKYGTRLLSLLAASGKFEAILEIISQIPKIYRLEALALQKHRSGNRDIRDTVLVALLKTPAKQEAEKIEMVHKLASFLPAEDREPFVTEFDADESVNALSIAVEFGSIQLIQALFTYVTSVDAHDKLAAWHATSGMAHGDPDRFFGNLFTKSVRQDTTGENLASLLDIYPPDRRFALVFETPIQNHIMHKLVATLQTAEPIERLLNRFTTDQQHVLITTPNSLFSVSLFHTATKYGQVSTLRSLITHYPQWKTIATQVDRLGYSLLHLATKARDPNTLEFLKTLFNSKERDAQLARKVTSCVGGTTSILTTISYDDDSQTLKRIIDLFSHKGFVAEIHKRESPIFTFMWKGKENILKILLQQLSPVEIRSVFSLKRDGQTPLQYAAQHGDHSTFEIIKQYFPDDRFVAEIRKTGANGNTILHYAAQNLYCATICTSFASALTKDQFIQLVSAPNNDGHTPLYYAVKSGYYQIDALLSCFSHDQQKAKKRLLGPLQKMIHETGNPVMSRLLS